MKKIRNIVLCFLLAPITACGDPFSFKLASVGVIAVSEGVFKNPEINLKEKNYAAADYLASQLKRENISYLAPIRLLPLEEMDSPGITSELGFNIPQGIGLRLIELGYSAQIHDVDSVSNSGLYPKPAQPEKSDYKMMGRYAVRDKNVDIYLRVIDSKTSKIVAQFNYVMPLNRELREMSKTKAVAFRVK